LTWELLLQTDVALDRSASGAIEADLGAGDQRTTTALALRPSTAVRLVLASAMLLGLAVNGVVAYRRGR
jgi:hypothetical protein